MPISCFLCREFEALNNDVDIGIKTGKGLRPPKLSAREITTPPKGEPLTVK